MQCTWAILSSVACPALHIFPHYLINGTIFGKKKLLNIKMYVSIFSTTFVWNIFHFKNNWATYNQKYILLNTLYNCPVLINLEFSRSFAKNTPTSNFMKILAVGAELFNADRQTDITKLIATFRNFANGPKNATVETSTLRTRELITYCSDANITACFVFLNPLNHSNDFVYRLFTVQILHTAYIKHSWFTFSS